MGYLSGFQTWANQPLAVLSLSPFPSLLFFPSHPSPSHSAPLPFPSLRSRPLKSSQRVWGSAKLTQRRLGWRKLNEMNLVHFIFKIWHLVVANLKIFLRINWPSFMQNFQILCRIWSWRTDSWGRVWSQKWDGIRGCKITGWSACIDVIVIYCLQWIVNYHLMCCYSAPVGVRSIVINPSVCLCVCLSVCPWAYLWNRWTERHEILCCRSPVAVARSSSGGVAMNNVAIPGRSLMSMNAC